MGLNRIKNKINAPVMSNDNDNMKKKPTSRSNNSNIKRNYIVVPYTRGLIESFKNLFKKYGIQVYLKGVRTIKELLVAPNDKDHISRKSGIIYRHMCGRLEFDEKDMGESSRTFGERFREHLRAPSPIFDHFNIAGHNTTLDNFSIVGREDINLMRLIKESIYIRVIVVDPGGQEAQTPLAPKLEHTFCAAWHLTSCNPL